MRTTDRRDAGTRIYWWGYPSRVALFVTLPIYLACWSLEPSGFEFYGHNHKFLEGSVAVMGLEAILGFALCSFLLEPLNPRRGPAVRLDTATVENATLTLAALVLVSYSIFLFPILLRPQLIIEHLMGSSTAMFTLRETLNRIPGVTSLMSLQSLLAVLIVSYRPLTGAPMPTLYKRLLVVVGCCCLLRAWLWSERLALIEYLMPIVIVTLSRFDLNRLRGRFRPLAFAPIAGAVALFAVFMVGEYFRSWQHYQHEFAGSFTEFIAVRLSGYYATSLNNGSALLTLLGPIGAPCSTAQWFYKFPLWSIIAPGWLNEPFDPTSFLETYLNPEFNNMSGIFLPLADFGEIWGVAFWMGLGIITGRIFNSFALGRNIGLMLYPVWFTGLTEMLRVFYWGETRFFPVLFGALFLGSYLNRHSRRRQPAALHATA